MMLPPFLINVTVLKYERMSVLEKIFKNHACVNMFYFIFLKSQKFLILPPYLFQFLVVLFI